MDSRSSLEERNKEDTYRANRYSITALLALSVALVILGGSVLVNPTSIIGMIFAAIGIVSMLFCIAFFVLYSHYLRRAEKEQNEA